MKLPLCHIDNYPRPQFVRKDFINLNGEWDFEFDPNNVGEKEKWYKHNPHKNCCNNSSLI